MYLKNIDHSFDVPIGDVGVTIRKGEKWRNIEIGTNLTLMNCKRAHKGTCLKTCRHEGYGEVIGVYKFEARSIPNSLIKIEHNKEARDKEVLIKMLERAYGKIKPMDILTAVIYVAK